MGIKQIWENLIKSFNNKVEGFSNKKLHAFYAVIIAGIITIKHVDSTIVVLLVTTWLGHSLVLQGINVYDKHKQNNSDPTIINSDPKYTEPS